MEPTTENFDSKVLHELLRSIQIKTNEGVPPQDILDALFTSLYGILTFDRIGLLLLEDNDRTVRLRWVKSISGPHVLDVNYSEPTKDSIVQKVIETGRPIIINNLRDYLEKNSYIRASGPLLLEGMQSGLIFPLRVNGKTIGAATLSTTMPHVYQEADADLFSAISEELSLILQNTKN